MHNFRIKRLRGIYDTLRKIYSRIHIYVSELKRNSYGKIQRRDNCNKIPFCFFWNRNKHSHHVRNVSQKNVNYISHFLRRNKRHSSSISRAQYIIFQRILQVFFKAPANKVLLFYVITYIYSHDNNLFLFKETENKERFVKNIRCKKKERNCFI